MISMPPNGPGDSLLFVFMHLPLKLTLQALLKAWNKVFILVAKKREKTQSCLFMLISSNMPYHSHGT